MLRKRMMLMVCDMIEYCLKKMDILLEKVIRRMEREA